MTGGKGVILSSGPGGSGSWAGMRGPADLINLCVLFLPLVMGSSVWLTVKFPLFQRACLIGMEANQAKVAIAETPRKVLLKARELSSAKLYTLSKSLNQDFNLLQRQENTTKVL